MSFMKPKMPKLPPPPPPPPQIDEAARSEEFSRKLARRKGRLATMYAGSGGSGPSTALRSALGISGGP